MLNRITPLLLTYNEAPNIGRTLEQLRWATDIVVVDSGSDDATLQILGRFPKVRLYQRKFDSHKNQWNFGLRETAITTEWILALDADYVLTKECAAEVNALQPAADVEGYRARFIYCVNGKRIRGGVYPPVTVLYRRGKASYIQDGHTHKLVLNGRIENLKESILHDDRKPLSHWFEAQSRYTRLEALKLRNTDPAELSWTDRIRRWRIVAPPAMLFYCLVLRLGVLDGWAGFYYAGQRALAELMLSLYLFEAGSRDKQVQSLKSKVQSPELNVEGPMSNV